MSQFEEYFLYFQARDTLARVSQQVVGYMKERNIHPNRPCFNRVAPEKGWIDKEMNLQQESHTETPLLHPLTPSKSSLSIYSNANGKLSDSESHLQVQVIFQDFCIILYWPN